MALKLTIIGELQSADARASIVFGVGGGSIGRSHDNDWVLPDAQHYLSAHHARIHFRQGKYYIEDTSTNGVYVNDATAPLGRNTQRLLHDGDHLRLGEYRIEVTVDGGNDRQAEASAVVALNHDPLEADFVFVQEDLGASLNLREFLEVQPDPAHIVAVDAYGQPVLREDSQRANGQAAARRQQRGSPADAASGADAFCRGAGINAGTLPADQQARVLHLAGLLLREALVGLKGLALAQREIRAGQHLDGETEDPERVSLQALPVEELLLRLLLGHERHELDAVQWLRDTFATARSHDIASVRALHAALAQYIARLEPTGTDGASVAARFRNITEMPAGRLPHLFAEAYARAFADEFKKDT